MKELLDIAFPYRVKRSFGAASFALVFLIAVAEVEALMLVALGFIGRRVDLFVALQEAILPVSCFIALASAVVFWWRARTWTRQRVEALNLWAGGGSPPKRPSF